MAPASQPYSDREVLEIFIETVDELRSSNYAKHIENGVQVDLIAGQDAIISHCTGPEREAVKAFLLTLRFFRQNNEVTSLQNMADRIQTLNVEQALKDGFLESRDNFNAFLDSPLDVPVPDARAGTKRDVFEAFLYGIYAHANPDHRRRVKEWEVLPFYGDLEAQFYVIAAQFMIAVTVMAETCRKTLATGNV